MVALFGKPDGALIRLRCRILGHDWEGCYDECCEGTLCWCRRCLMNDVHLRVANGQACGLCGKDPAEGFASIDGVRYCHGDCDPEPTCYVRAQLYHPGYTLFEGTEE